MGLGVATFLGSAWRHNKLAPTVIEVLPANYGTEGSRAHYRNRRTDTILVSGQDPRIRRWNGLIPIVWRLRVVDKAKVASVEAHAPQTLGTPVTFTQPRTASLLANGGTLPK
jgi:hypothetical protein